MGLHLTDINLTERTKLLSQFSAILTSFYCKADGIIILDTMAIWSSRVVTEDTLTLKHASSIYIWKTVVLQCHPLYPGYVHSCFLCLDYVRNDSRNFPSSHIVKGMWNQMSPACIKVSVGHVLLWAMAYWESFEHLDTFHKIWWLSVTPKVLFLLLALVHLQIPLDRLIPSHR